MNPNNLFFFPVKVQIWPDLMVEISNGNTLEISTSGPLKSKKMVQHRPKIPNFRSQICCRQKSLTGPNFYFLKNMTLQLHFALRIKAIAQKVANLSQVEVCGFYKKTDLILRSRNLNCGLGFCQNPQTSTLLRFATFWAMILIRSAKWSCRVIFFKT